MAKRDINGTNITGASVDCEGLGEASPPSIGPRQADNHPGWRIKIFIVLSVALHLLAFFVVPFNENRETKEVGMPAFIIYTEIDKERTDSAFEELAVFFDSESLFLPTQWNYANAVDLPVFEEQLPLFDSFSPLIKLGASIFEMYVELPLVVPDPNALLRNEYWDTLMTFGQVSKKIEPFVRRVTFARIIDLQSGKNVLSFPITRIEDVDAFSLPWKEASFLILVELQGNMGIPLMTRSSGVDSVDERLKSYLGNEPFFLSLQPGYYNIIFNP